MLYTFCGVYNDYDSSKWLYIVPSYVHVIIVVCEVDNSILGLNYSTYVHQYY